MIQIISSLATIAAIIIAVIAIILSFRDERRAKELASRAMILASIANELASLAIARVSSSRASRLEEEVRARSSSLCRNHY